MYRRLFFLLLCSACVFTHLLGAEAFTFRSGGAGTPPINPPPPIPPDEGEPPAPPEPPPLPPLLPADYFVSPTGNDTNNGTSAATAWRTIQRAANAAVAGDVVSVAAGTYNERVTFPNSGTAGNPITFQGASPTTTIIDGGKSASGWTPASGFTAGVYEIANTAFGFGADVPAHASVDDKTFLFVRPNSSPDQRGIINISNSDPKWNGMEAACANYGTITRCRFRDNADPDTKNLKLAPWMRGALHISNKSYITITGFRVKNTFSALVLADNAHHIIAVNNIFNNGYYTVHMRDGAHHNTVQQNTIRLNWIYSNHGLPRHNPTTGAIDPTQNNLLNCMRTYAPIMASISVKDVGDDNTILWNTINYTGAAGIDISTTVGIGTVGKEQKRLDIGYNDISRCQDYCIQAQLTQAEGLRIHDNFIHTYYDGMRFGQMNGRGPVYVYRNRWSNPEAKKALGAGCDLVVSGYPTPGTSIFNNTIGFFYHNTFGGNDCAFAAYSGQNLDRWAFVNNVWSSGGFWYTSPGLAGNPSFFKGNWVGGQSAPSSAPSWATAPNVYSPPNTIWSSTETAFNLPNGHAAINLGVNLSTSWNAGSLGTQPALPGMTAGYFNGAAPDAGAVEHP